MLIIKHVVLITGFSNTTVASFKEKNNVILCMITKYFVLKNTMGSIIFDSINFMVGKMLFRGDIILWFHHLLSSKLFNI